MAEALRGLPSVATAEVEVTLPDKLDVAVHERDAAARSGAPRHGAFLVDVDGHLAGHRRPTDSTLPAVEDQRASAADLASGDRLDDVDLAAARLLLTITPADVGSASTATGLYVNDADGWYMTASQPDWRAIFGHYTANQLDRMTEYRVSGSASPHCWPTAWAGRRWSTCAVEGDRCGTFRDEPTPSAEDVQNVGERAA